MIEISSPRVIFIYPEEVCVPSTYWAKGVEFKFMWINVYINYNLKGGSGCGYSFVSIVIYRLSQYHDSSYFPQSSKFSIHDNHLGLLLQHLETEPGTLACSFDKYINK